MAMKTHTYVCGRYGCSGIAAIDGGGCTRLFVVVQVVYVGNTKIVDIVVCDCTHLFEVVIVFN